MLTYIRFFFSRVKLLITCRPIRGGPLDERNTTGQADDEEADELKESDDKLRKEFIKSEYLAGMEKQSEEGTHSGVNTYYFMTASELFLCY